MLKKPIHFFIICCAALLVTACFHGDNSSGSITLNGGVRELFVLLPDEAFSELHPVPSVSLRRRMMTEGFESPKRFFDEQGVTYRLSTEKRFVSDTFLAFSNTFSDGGVFYSIKAFTPYKGRRLVAITRVYGEKCCARSKTLFFIFAHGTWKNISDRDPLGLNGLHLQDFNDFSKYKFSEQIKNNPPIHVVLPVHGTDVKAVLDHQAFRSLDGVRNTMRSLDNKAMNSLIARLEAASEILFRFRGLQFIRQPSK